MGCFRLIYPLFRSLLTQSVDLPFPGRIPLFLRESPCAPHPFTLASHRDRSKRRKLRIKDKGPVNPVQSLLQGLARSLLLLSTGEPLQDVVYLINHLPHHLSKGLVRRAVNKKAGTVGGDGKKIGVDFPPDSGGNFSPVIETKEIPLNGDLLHLHFDSDINRRSNGGGENDDLSMDRTKFCPFKEMECDARSDSSG